MSNQEPTFANPGTAYEERRPINTDPREQPQWQATPPMPGFGMARPPQQGHSPWRWLGISVVILVVIFGGLFTASALLSRTIIETKSFSVGNHPTVALDNGNGSVHVVNGPAGTVSIVARKRVFMGDTNQLPIHYDLSSDHQTLTITADDEARFSFFNFNYNQGVDFDVTLPEQATLNVHTGNGDLSAAGISGQVRLDTGNGSIDASRLDGELTLKTGNGSITGQQIQASGSSTFKTGNGTITFDGSLDRQGNYLFTTGNGAIDVTLPGNASFQVYVDTGNGSIDSDFAYGADGKVGSGPAYAQVTLHTGNGSIHLHRGS